MFFEILQNSQENTRPATLLRKRTWSRCFTVNFAKFLRTPFVKKHLRWLCLTSWSVLGKNTSGGGVDILMISETKLDEKDFLNPYRLDRNSHGGGILVYVRDNIPSNLVKVSLLN